MKFTFKIVLFIFSFIFFIILYFIYFNLKIEKKDGNKIKKLPYISLIDLNNNSFTNNDINKINKRIIINYFSPNCDHCQNMAKQFINDSIKLKKFQIIMITSADSTSAVKFNNYYKLALLSNISVLRDTNYQFQRIFGVGIIPSFFIYDHNKLVKKIIGETKIENLIN